MNAHDREKLARDASGGLLEPLMCWLTYVSGGYDQDGLWQPASRLSLDQCIEILERLSERQLAELRWRGLIPPLASDSDESDALADDFNPILHHTPSGALVVHTELDDRTLYQLDDEAICVWDNELELLNATGFPNCWPDVMAVLWRSIAPALDRQTTAQRLRDIIAVLSTSTLDPATQLAQVRELAIWPFAADELVVELVQAESDLIRTACAAVQRGSQDHDLAAAVRTYQAATERAFRAGALLRERTISPS